MSARFVDNAQLNSDALQFGTISAAGTVSAGQTGNVDVALPLDAVLIAGQLVLNGHVFGDSVTFQVVHPVAGVVGEYVTGWYVSPGVSGQAELRAPFPANIPAGLSLRCAYTSTGGADVQVRVNYELGWVQ